MPTRTGQTSRFFEEVNYETAETFIDALLPHRVGPLTGNAAFYGWMFRGQQNANWGLQPSGLRYGNDRNPFTMFIPGQVVDIPRGSLQDQTNSEEHWVIDFCSRVTIAGMEVPGDHPELRDRSLAIENHDGRNFPPVRQRFMYALAQHYGVPTRFLDWTTAPLVAAYFAAVGGVSDSLRPGQSDQKIAVWALNRPFVEGLPDSWNPRPVVVTVPTTSNPNLRAQKGMFTLVRYNAGSGPVDFPPNLEELLSNPEREAEYYRQPNTSLRPVLVKLTLPARECRALMYFLHQFGVDASTVYPGLHSQIEAMKELKLHEVRRLPVDC